LTNARREDSVRRPETAQERGQAGRRARRVDWREKARQGKARTASAGRKDEAPEGRTPTGAQGRERGTGLLQKQLAQDQHQEG